MSFTTLTLYLRSLLIGSQVFNQEVTKSVAHIEH